jgi:HEAT repeat protein
MHAPAAPLLTALLALAAPPSPPPPPQPTRTLTSSDNVVSKVGGKTFKQWADDLKHPDASVREEAIRALVNFGADSPRAAPLLVERLRDPDSSPRVKAAIALGMIDIRKEDIPKVAQALGQCVAQDPQAVVRYQAAVVLNRLGEDAHYALPGLCTGAADKSTWEIRQVCISTLRVAGRDPGDRPNPAVVRALLGALNDNTYMVRLEAVVAIGTLGRPEDRQLLLAVVRALQERVTERNHTVRLWANVALMALDQVTDKGLQAVAKFLKDPDARVRANAARGLGVLGNKAKPAAAALTDALQDEEVTVVTAAGWALAQLDELSGPARAALLDLLKSPKPDFRAAAAQSFGSAGIKARAAVPALTALLLDRDQPPYVVTSACWALGEIGEPDPSALAALKGVEERKDTEESLKQVARTALEQINKLKK